MSAESRATSERPKRSLTQRLTSAAIQISGIVIIFFAFSAWQTRHLLAERLPSPDFRLNALSGESVSLESLRGRRVLLHFWATWCGVCRREFDALSAVHRGLAEDEVLLTIVEDSDDVEKLRRFSSDNGIEYPVLLGTEDVLSAFRVTAYPTNYYIDAAGLVRSTTVGMSTRWSMNARLAWLK